MFLLLDSYHQYADLGVLAGLQTLIIMFVILSGLGLPYGSTRFISMYIGSGENKEADNLYPTIFVICVGLSALFSLILFGISSQISESLFHGSVTAQLIQLTSLDIFLYSVITTCAFLLTASIDFKKLTCVSIINSVMKYSLSFGLLVLGLELHGIILGLVIGDSISLVLFLYFLWPKIFGKKLGFYSVLEIRPLLKYSLSTYGFLVINFLSIRVDVYLLLALSTLYQVGIYTPAIFVVSTFLMILVAMDQVLLPIFSRIYGKLGIRSFKYYGRYISRYLFLFYYPLGFALAASAHSLIGITLGERFIESAYPIVIIMISITLTCPGIVVTNLLRSAGYTRVILESAAIGLFVQILISIITIPSLGVIGVAGARSISRAIFFIYPILELKKIGGFDIDVTALKRGIYSSLLVVSVIISIDQILIGPYSLLVQYSVALISYLVFLRVTQAINMQDIQLMDKVLLGKMKWLPILLKETLVKS